MTASETRMWPQRPPPIGMFSRSLRSVLRSAKMINETILQFHGAGGRTHLHNLEIAQFHGAAIRLSVSFICPKGGPSNVFDGLCNFQGCAPFGTKALIFLAKGVQ